jgi:hypothetical protein
MRYEKGMRYYTVKITKLNKQNDLIDDPIGIAGMLLTWDISSDIFILQGALDEKQSKLQSGLPRYARIIKRRAYKKAVNRKRDKADVRELEKRL